MAAGYAQRRVCHSPNPMTRYKTTIETKTITIAIRIDWSDGLDEAVLASVTADALPEICFVKEVLLFGEPAKTRAASKIQEDRMPSNINNNDARIETVVRLGGIAGNTFILR